MLPVISFTDDEVALEGRSVNVVRDVESRTIHFLVRSGMCEDKLAWELSRAAARMLDQHYLYVGHIPFEPAA